MSIHLNYTEKGTGIPFIFQHGLGANLSQPQKLLATIGSIKLISIDCPGHGSSPLPDHIDPSFDYYANQVVGLMENLNIRKAIFGGISMGSGIALNIALKFPDKALALVLVRPAWLDQGTPDNLAILLEIANLIRQHDGEAIFVNSADFKRIEASLLNAAQSLLGPFDTSQREELPRVLEKLVNDKPFNDIKDLKQIDRPCLVIGNNDDPLHPLEMAQKIHQHIRGSEIYNVISRYIDDTKHSDSIKQTVSNFITKHEKFLEKY